LPQAPTEVVRGTRSNEQEAKITAAGWGNPAAVTIDAAVTGRQWLRRGRSRRSRSGFGRVRRGRGRSGGSGEGRHAGRTPARRGGCTRRTGPGSRSHGCATRSLATVGRCTGETGTSSSTSTTLPSPPPTHPGAPRRDRPRPHQHLLGLEPFRAAPPTFEARPKSRLPRWGLARAVPRRDAPTPS
jgi:hypothetical protein